MPVLHALVLAATLAAEPVPDGAVAARAAMREALREAAPLPSGRPALPAGVLPAGQMTDAARAMKRDAERMAIDHAKKSAGEARHDARSGAVRSGDAGETMHGDRQGSDPACDPAQMMRSRGMTPGGPMVPNNGPPHRGM